MPGPAGLLVQLELLLPQLPHVDVWTSVRSV